MKSLRSDEIRKAVRENYSKIAENENAGGGCNPSSCCDSSCATSPKDISKGLE